MIPLVRSPLSKHKYDIERNEMRKEIGWLQENERKVRTIVSLRYSNNQQCERLHKLSIYKGGVGQHSLPPLSY